MSDAANEDKRTPRKFLVVVDETPECERAIVYAARRARRVGASIVALSVGASTDFQHWLGVETLMREQAEQEAGALLDRVLARFDDIFPGTVEKLVAFGDRADAIRKVIAEDPSIAVLFLAAAAGSDGPGPLVSAIAGHQSGAFPVPITIVPGALTDADIDEIA